MILKQIHCFDNFSSSLLFGVAGVAVIGIVSSVHIILSRHARHLYRERKRKKPQTVRGVVIRSYNGISSIEVRSDLPSPKILNPDEVLIGVMAAGLETMDLKIARGYGRSIRSYLMRHNEHVNDPSTVILGRECSGIVLGTGRDVTSLFKGDEVWAVSPYCLEGLLSECVVVKESAVCLKPRNLTHVEAAGLPYTALQVYNALVLQSGLGPQTTTNKRVLVLAGNTPFGLFAMQMLKAWGGEVTAAVPTAGLPMCHVLNTDDVIVYTVTDYEMELRKRKRFDVVINSTGTIVHPLCVDICAPGGKVVTFTTTFNLSDRFGVFLGSLMSLAVQATAWIKKMSRGRRSNNFWWDTLSYDKEYLEKIRMLIEQNKISPIIESVYDMEDAVYAYRQMAKYDNVGKCVIRVQDDITRISTHKKPCNNLI